jgi:hypothetical protein
MALFCFSVKWFIDKDFFCLFRLDPVTELEVERISLVPFKINYSQSCSPESKVIHNMTFFSILSSRFEFFKLSKVRVKRRPSIFNGFDPSIANSGLSGLGITIGGELEYHSIRLLPIHPEIGDHENLFPGLRPRSYYTTRLLKNKSI